MMLVYIKRKIMGNLREIAKECLNAKKEEYEENEKVNVTGARYIVIFENNVIKQSDFDIILNSLDIQIAYIFPKIHYTPMSNWYNSFLSPIIVNNSLEPFEGRQVIQNWTIEYSGQSLCHTPSSNSSLSVNFQNKKFDFEAQTCFSINEFEIFYPLIVNLANCSSKSEAVYVFDMYKKNRSIEILGENISRLNSEIHIKEKIIEGYEDLLSRISDLLHKDIDETTI